MSRFDDLPYSMALKQKASSSTSKSTPETVEEIMNIHRALPTRPTIEEVEAAKVLISNVDSDDQFKLEAIERQTKSPDVPEELFKILLDMQRYLISFNSKEQKKDALKLLELEDIHTLFDELIQRASKCVSSSSNSENTNVSAGSYSIPPLANAGLTRISASPLLFESNVRTSPKATSNLHLADNGPTKTTQLFTRDDSYVQKGKSTPYIDGLGTRLGVSSSSIIKDSSLQLATASGQGDKKLSGLQLAHLIGVSEKNGTRELNLQNKLVDQIDRLPDSIEKLRSLYSLDLSENRIATLASTIGALSQLQKLDLHGNRIIELPETFTDLISLTFLDLRGNQLVSLPSSFGKLIRLQEVDLSSNGLQSLPESLGNLVGLRKLNIEMNDLEEIPHTIGRCCSLMELSADYNKLKALPEAVGKIASLEILSVRYNNIKTLPTTMSSLINLRELNVSFNELEAIPESLCFATNIVKMNIGNNFAAFRELPKSIGNLERLEDLDICNNQIRRLPRSFRLLTQLRTLRAEGNPFDDPPRDIFDNGAQAVVQYMTEVYENEVAQSQPAAVKKSWMPSCFFFKRNKTQRGPANNIQS